MTVFIVELEPVESRYTKQWKEHLPQQMRDAGLPVEVIEGPQDAPQDTTPGAFLNFSGTNYWKSEQLKTIASMFAAGKVKDGDYFLYTDAWNPTVLQLKYMAELLGVKIKIGGMWHAGSYDPADFLGRLIGNAPWVRHTEKALFHVFDQNFFATQFHVDMFASELLHDGLFNEYPWYEEYVAELLNSGKIVIAGWPMEYLKDAMLPYADADKEDLILFPHRIAPEKQLEIFKDLEKHLPQYKFVVCQEQKLSKHEYHKMLAKAKIVFSANLQETLGISWYEGALVGAIPVVPDRLSYSEMSINWFKYPSEWTESFEAYEKHREQLCVTIMDHMIWFETRQEKLQEQVNVLSNKFFSGNTLYEAIRKMI
jgi:hypothetical protein